MTTGRAGHGSSRTGVVPLRRGPAGRAVRRVPPRRPRRRRLAGLLRFIVFLLLVFVAVWAGVRVAHAGPDASVDLGQRYVVRSGDTLWTIAARHYGEGTDLRRTVFDIRVASGLHGSALMPGATLTLPYEGP